ncbi:hypothetical protein MIND_00668100 [Mycena indigotica]|uniref:Uncharacterized protein n=1 Tax=Mycena indigotica TaxID=2126181 RepID=A0A8H6SL78_9AGAR|nr:uncharacterized protein MIND_00668100 [Mycena indigotica]KAF7301043.1 hypothetical protein MIND_00668100 [Mycena indigotica]
MDLGPYEVTNAKELRTTSDLLKLLANPECDAVKNIHRYHPKQAKLMSELLTELKTEGIPRIQRKELTAWEQDEFFAQIEQADRNVQILQRTLYCGHLAAWYKYAESQKELQIILELLGSQLRNSLSHAKLSQLIAEARQKDVAETNQKIKRAITDFQSQSGYLAKVRGRSPMKTMLKLIPEIVTIANSASLPNNAQVRQIAQYIVCGKLLDKFLSSASEDTEIISLATFPSEPDSNSNGSTIDTTIPFNSLSKLMRFFKNYVDENIAVAEMDEQRFSSIYGPLKFRTIRQPSGLRRIIHFVPDSLGHLDILIRYWCVPSGRALKPDKLPLLYTSTSHAQVTRTFVVSQIALARRSDSHVYVQWDGGPANDGSDSDLYLVEKDGGKTFILATLLGNLRSTDEVIPLPRHKASVMSLISPNTEEWLSLDGWTAHGVATLPSNDPRLQTFHHQIFVPGRDFSADQPPASSTGYSSLGSHSDNQISRMSSR